MLRGHSSHNVLENPLHDFDELRVELGHGRSSRYGRRNTPGSAILCLAHLIQERPPTEDHPSLIGGRSLKLLAPELHLSSLCSRRAISATARFVRAWETCSRPIPIP